MYSSLAGRRVEDLAVLADGGVILQLSDNVSCQFTGRSVEFGSGIALGGLPVVAAACSKNIERDPCTLDFVKGVLRGLPITSAADFGDYLEFGLDQRFNLGMHIRGFHLVSTQSPVSKHRL